MNQLASILRSIGVSKNKSTKIDVDAIADFSVIMGDINSRFQSTFSKHIDKIKNSKDMIKDLDELYEDVHINGYLNDYFEE